MRAMCRDQRRKAAALLGLVALLPGGALAEGAVRLLNCESTRICDADGQCSAASQRVSFRMEPLRLDSMGAGEYRLIYEDADVEMQASSEAGPFLWVRDTERHTLLASSETRFLWHRLRLDGEPRADIHFLSCAISR